MTRSGSGRAIVLAIVAVVGAGGVRVRTDDPVSSNVRYTGEIVRIFDRRCLGCHADQGLAMPLTTYGDVRSWGRAIREEIIEQRMPPWAAARGYGRFRNELSLSAREMLTLLSWIDGGMPRGDDRELPVASANSERPAPDVRVPLPVQRVPAAVEHVVRHVAIDVDLDPGRPIARVAIAPDATRVLRGALVFEADAAGAPARWLGAWLPWQHEAAPPAPSTFRLPPRARLVVELHYRGAADDVTDAPAVDIYYGSRGARPSDQIAVSPGAPVSLPASASVWAIVPSPGESAASLQVSAREPDGATSVLLWIPHVSHVWPQVLLPDRPVVLPAGTVLSVNAVPGDRSTRVRLAVLP